MNHEHRPYGWKSAEQSHSHAYLLPGVQKRLRQLFGDRRVRIVDLGCGNEVDDPDRRKVTHACSRS